MSIGGSRNSRLPVTFKGFQTSGHARGDSNWSLNVRYKWRRVFGLLHSRFLSFFRLLVYWFLSFCRRFLSSFPQRYFSTRASKLRPQVSIGDSFLRKQVTGIRLPCGEHDLGRGCLVETEENRFGDTDSYP